MMDKELALIISEMLIKQDETTSQVKDVTAQIKETNLSVQEVAYQIKETNLRVEEVAYQIKETNYILKDFVSISIKQWEQQQIFNERIVTELKEIKEVLSTLTQLDTRLKAIEERESKFESRLANVERLLRAS